MSTIKKLQQPKRIRVGNVDSKKTAATEKNKSRQRVLDLYIDFDVISSTHPYASFINTYVISGFCCNNDIVYSNVTTSVLYS